MKIRNNDVLFVDLRSNHHIKLNPCIGCVNRGRCEGERYSEPGEYCRSFTRKDK